MRVLFTSRQGFGHFHPLAPLAQAARDAGHEAGFAMPPAFSDTVDRLGFRWLAAGLDESSPEYNHFVEERNRLPARERAGFMRRGAASVLAPRMAAELPGTCDARRPDVFVRDASDVGGSIAGEALGIPQAAHQAGAFIPAAFRIVAAPLDELRAAHGLAPDPELRTLERHSVLSPFPPSLNGSRGMMCPTPHRYRAAPLDRSGDEGAPEWPLPVPGAPLVYATLGAVVNTRTEVLRAFVEALRGERVNLVVTVGRAGDPDRFGPQPPNVRIERYIPQTPPFPRCDLAVSHGGSNTMLAAPAHGIPQVMVPSTADRPENADRCAAAGVARVVPLAEVTAASVREAALAGLADPSYRLAAGRARDELAALPGTDQAVARLERLAQDKAPIVASR